ncbi:mas-related G-protein coupled receptor member D-like [Melospiza melodia melodia]|uniref:mas-related G-protein coupled receptor member D-like n=1 Tax=Melospiza melodia melodia TaxID=1914991 RepID=UPI002FD1C622
MARGHIPLPAQHPSIEVSTVSPSPASLTEGDDLCDTDVTTLATHSVTLLICLCGLAGNRAVISLLSLKGDNFFIRGMAVTDFLFLLLTVPSVLILLEEDVSCSLILPVLYLHFLFQLSLFSCYWAPLWLMTFGLAMYIKKLLKCCCRRDIPDHLLWVVMIVQFWAFSTLFTEIPTLTSQCQSNYLEHCQAALITTWAIILLLLVTPITVLVFSSTINSIKAKWGSQQQQPEGLDIVAVSIGLFTLLSILWNFLQQLCYIAVHSHFFFLLTCTNSSMKSFIFFLAGRCWRPCSVGTLWLSPQRVCEEPEENPAHRNDPTKQTDV